MLIDCTMVVTQKYLSRKVLMLPRIPHYGQGRLGHNAGLHEVTDVECAATRLIPHSHADHGFLVWRFSLMHDREQRRWGSALPRQR